jgi:hypothetical protein
MKKTAIHSPNYTDGGKNGGVVEMLLSFSVIRSFRSLFLPVLRSDEKILKFVEIAPEENAKPLGIWGSLVKQVVIRSVEHLEAKFFGQLEIDIKITADIAGLCV